MGKYIFQSLMFMGHVRFRGGKSSRSVAEDLCLEDCEVGNLAVDSTILCCNLLFLAYPWSDPRGIFTYIFQKKRKTQRSNVWAGQTSFKNKTTISPLRCFWDHQIKAFFRFASKFRCVKSQFSRVFPIQKVAMRWRILNGFRGEHGGTSNFETHTHLCTALFYWSCPAIQWWLAYAICLALFLHIPLWHPNLSGGQNNPWYVPLGRKWGIKSYLTTIIFIFNLLPCFYTMIPHACCPHIKLHQKKHIQDTTRPYPCQPPPTPPTSTRLVTTLQKLV